MAPNSDNAQSVPASLLTPYSFSDPLLEAARQVESSVKLLQREMKKAQRGGAIQTARAFVAMRYLNNQLDEALKPVGRLYDEAKTVTVPEMFEAEKVTSIPLSEGFRVGISSRLWASIKPEDKGGDREQARAWLRKNRLGDLISETVNASSLSAAAKAMMEEENRELPDSLFNVTVVWNTSVTPTSKK